MTSTVANLSTARGVGTARGAGMSALLLGTRTARKPGFVATKASAQPKNATVWSGKPPIVKIQKRVEFTIAAELRVVSV